MLTKSYAGWRCGSVLNHLAFGMPRVRPLTLKTYVIKLSFFSKKKADNKIMCIINSQLCSSMHKYTPGSPHLLSVAVLNKMTKSHLGKERLYFSCGSVLWTRQAGAQGRTWMRKLKQGSWRGTAYWLPSLRVLTSFLLHPRTTCPRTVPLTVG